MAFAIQARAADVQALLAREEELAPLAPSLQIQERTLPPPRRSLEDFPTFVTVVDFIGTALATNIAYDVGKKLLFDALRRRFGDEKVKEVDDHPEPPPS